MLKAPISRQCTIYVFYVLVVPYPEYSHGLWKGDSSLNRIIFI